MKKLGSDALATSKTKTLLVADCMEKLIRLSEKSRGRVVWTHGHSRTEQNETINSLTGESVKTIPIGLAPYTI